MFWSSISGTKLNVITDCYTGGIKRPLILKASTKWWYFESFNILKPLNHEEKTAINCASSMRNYKKGQSIYLPTHSSDKIFFLKKGKVKISRDNQKGKELILSILGPGELFGELSLSESSTRREKAETLEESLVCGIYTKDLAPIVARNPKLALNITKIVGLRLIKVEHQLESLYFKSVDERIKDYIKELADTYGRKIGIGFETEVKLNLTHSDIAKLTATTRQSVCTLFSELEKKNIISYNRKRILIRDYNALL